MSNIIWGLLRDLVLAFWGVVALIYIGKGVYIICDILFCAIVYDLKDWLAEKCVKVKIKNNKEGM